MKHLIFTISMLLCAVINAMPQTKQVDADNANIRYEGRVNFTDATAPSMGYPGTSINACFTGTSIALKMKPGSGYFMVGIDDKDFHKIYFGETDSVITVATGLTPGRHTIKAMLVNEQYEQHSVFTGFIIDEDAELLDMGKDNRTLIEFIGDSMTCGYGTEASDWTIRYSPSNSNFYYTFGAIIARELDMRLTVVARSGIGAYRNYNGKDDGGIMPQWYDYTLIYDDSQLWDTTGNVPDILCIDLGTNDFSTTGWDAELYRQGYEKFVRHLRSLYPETKIIILSGCMLNGEQLELQNAALNQIYNTLKSEGDNNIYRFDFTPQDGSLGYGADYHPSKAQHRKMANELIPFLRTLQK